MPIYEVAQLHKLLPTTQIVANGIHDWSCRYPNVVHYTEISDICITIEGQRKSSRFLT